MWKVMVSKGQHSGEQLSFQPYYGHLGSYSCLIQHHSSTWLLLGGYPPTGSLLPLVHNWSTFSRKPPLTVPNLSDIPSMSYSRDALSAPSAKPMGHFPECFCNYLKHVVLQRKPIILRWLSKHLTVTFWCYRTSLTDGANSWPIQQLP